MNNSLAKVHPELVSEWSEKNLTLTPGDITFGSNKKVWWKGACGHEWKTSVKARSNGEKCPYCSGYIFLKGFNNPDYVEGGDMPKTIANSCDKCIYCAKKRHAWQ